MSHEGLLAPLLASEIGAVIGKSQPGSCLRVDDLDAVDADEVILAIRRQAHERCIVVRLASADDVSETTITADHAIELRDLKNESICLFVPAGFADPTTSSLGNSFAAFDLHSAYRSIAQQVERALPDSIRDALRDVRSQLRGAAAIPVEAWAEYVAAVAAAPSLQCVGRHLWRVGLIPDGDEAGPSLRLSENRRCSTHLIRPPRPQTSASDRLDELGVSRGPIRDELLSFFSYRLLRDSRTWQAALAESPQFERLSFDSWVFEGGGESDLLEIVADPFVDIHGEVDPRSKLTQPNGPGTQPLASVGPRKTVVVRWNSRPTTPTNLTHWRAEVIPSRLEYAPEEVAGIELPSTRVTGRMRRAALSLDIDLEGLEVRAAQIRIVGLDINGGELTAGDAVVEGLSQEFWLAEESDVPDLVRPKQSAASNLSLARLTAAVELDVTEIEEAPGSWTDRSLRYYSITLNGRRVVRVGMPAVLLDIEGRALLNPDDLGRYAAECDVAEGLDLKAISTRPMAGREAAMSRATFVSRRRELFKLICDEETRNRVEALTWNEQLLKRARAYGLAYKDWLDHAQGDEAREALEVDTIHLTLRGAILDDCVLVMPTHPLRLYWYAAYCELLRGWEGEVLGSPRKRRPQLIDLKLLERVAAHNVPAFLGSQIHPGYVFTQNLRFFWGLATPAGSTRTPEFLAQLGQILGLPAEDCAIAHPAPAVLATQLANYLDVHPYVETMQIGLLNPGDGTYAADAVERMIGKWSEGTDDLTLERDLPRLDITGWTTANSIGDLPVLSDLQARMYEFKPPIKTSSLAPFMTVSSLGGDPDARAKLGRFNVIVATDSMLQLMSSTETVGPDSSSFYGLLTRITSQFETSEGEYRWTHAVSLPDVSRERHPSGNYAADLVAMQRSFIRKVGSLMVGGTNDAVPAIIARLSPEDRIEVDRLHRQADWVVSIERFAGVEFFDDPGDPLLAGIARKYLLDFTPEFMDGLGYHLSVSTAHRREIEEVLGRAMRELGFGLVEESVGQVLDHLKLISGRLALRTIGDEGRAREAVSLGVVAAYLRLRGQLADSIVVPVDAHPELFGVGAQAAVRPDGFGRCDLILVRFLRDRLVASFVEVKSRSGAGMGEELLDRIADQVATTQDLFESLFFSQNPTRLDQTLQRARLGSILRFYVERANRYSLVGADRARQMHESISRLESGALHLRSERLGFIVSLGASPQQPINHRDTEIRLITATDLMNAGLLGITASPAQGQATRSSVKREAPRSSESSSGGATPSGTDPQSEPTSRDGGVQDSPAQHGAASSDADSTGGNVSALAMDETGPIESATGIQPEVDGVPAVVDIGETQTLSGDVSVELGLSIVDQLPVTWRVSLRGSPHLFILGIPGQGKSWTVLRIMRELHSQGITSLGLDFHGQLAAQARELGERTIAAEDGLPFSPFEADPMVNLGADYWKTSAFSIAEIFQYVCELGDIQRDVVYEALRDCYQATGFGEATPAARLPTVAELQDQLLVVEQQRGVRNVVPRCRPLLDFGLFRNEASDEFSGMLRQPLVVDLHGLPLEAMQLAGAAFVLRKVYKDMFRWGETDRLRLVVVLDEAHRLAKDVTLPKLMKEGRKFGVVVVVASQSVADYHQDVIANVGSKIIFRTNSPLSRRVAALLGSKREERLAPVIEQLGVGEAYVQTLDMPRPARTRMHPLLTSTPNRE